ncbi:11707_t:CDS:2, partial [Diversispora eburnea]
MSRRALVSILRWLIFNNFQYQSDFSDIECKERRTFLEEKESKKYLKLGKSGKIWKTYFRPFKICANDYEEISIIKDTAKISQDNLLQRMIVGFSHQSCVIEGNSLG